MSTEKSDKNAIEDLAPGMTHADAVRGGAKDDAPAKKEKKAMKPTKDSKDVAGAVGVA
jgi:hypothetical protein